MSGSKQYKSVKNYIHNELGLSKEDIREMIKLEVKKEAMRCFKNTYGNDTDVEGWIRHMVKDEITRYKYNMVENAVKETVRQEVVENLVIEIKQKKGD